MNYDVKFYNPSSDDFTRLSAYVLKHSNCIAENTSWSYQRFVDWRYGHIEQENTFCAKTLIRFLDAADEIMGIAINEDGDNSLTLLTTLDSSELYERFLNDAIDKLMAGQDSVYLELSEKQIMERACIKKMGFLEAGGSKKMTYQLDALNLPEVKLKDGFRIVSMAESSLYAQQGRLRASAFQGKSDLTDEELKERLMRIEVMKQSPTFNPSTDLVVLDEAGNAIAGCEPLINFHTRDAEIERVCTLDSYRSQGFSKAVITEAMIRLKKAGIQKAYLSGWNDTTIHLYKSFGPHETLEITSYKLEL